MLRSLVGSEMCIRDSTGTICGIKVEEVKNPITKQVRYLDKLVDELAKGKDLDKILR